MGEQILFLQNVNAGLGDPALEAQEVIVYLSDYNHDKVRALPNISPLRWVTLVDGVLEPGKGSGTLRIGDASFQVTYAWGGRNKPPPSGWVDRTSYTTAISGDLNVFSRLLKQIIADENGGQNSKTYTFREHAVRMGLRNKKDFRKWLLESNEARKKYKWEDMPPYSPTEIADKVMSWSKDWRKNTKTFVIPFMLTAYETDMLA